MQTGETPFTHYNYVLPEVWEGQKQTPEAKAKSEQFSELAKRNQHHHHLVMTGYAAKKPQWRAEERALAEAGLPGPYVDCDDRSLDFLKGRVLKKLKEGRPSSTSCRPRRWRRGLWRLLRLRRAGRSNLIERGTY